MFYYFLYPCSVPWYLSLVLKIYGIQVQVLGTPTREEIKCMNPNYTEFKFPQIKAHPWHKVIERYFFLSVYAHYFIVIFIYIYIWTFIIRSFTSVCHLKLWISCQDYYNTLQIFDAQLWVFIFFKMCESFKDISHPIEYLILSWSFMAAVNGIIFQWYVMNSLVCLIKNDVWFWIFIHTSFCP